MGCLNNLEKDVVFIPAAALIALVLLVWVQLGAPRDKKTLDEDMNLWFGILWSYAAIFFALVAVALFVHEHKSDCAKGFLILSFLMTIANILMVLGLNFIKIVFHKPSGKSLTGVCISSGLWAKGWFLFWILLLFGLGFISFYLADCWPCWSLWIGIALVAAAALFAIVVFMWKFIRRRRKFWILVWLSKLVGLAMIVLAIFASSLVKGWCPLWFWVVVGIELMVIPYLAVFIVTKCCPYTCLRQGWWRNGEGEDGNGGECGE